MNFINFFFTIVARLSNEMAFFLTLLYDAFNNERISPMLPFYKDFKRLKQLMANM